MTLDVFTRFLGAVAYFRSANSDRIVGRWAPSPLDRSVGIFRAAGRKRTRHLVSLEEARELALCALLTRENGQ